MGAINFSFGHFMLNYINNWIKTIGGMIDDRSKTIGPEGGE